MNYIYKFMNTWLTFLKNLYSSDRKIHKECSNSGTIKRAVKIYKCKQNLGNKTKKDKELFKGKNPMHNKTKKRN